MRPFMDSKGVPVLATPELLTRFESAQVEDAPVIEAEAPVVEAVEAPVASKRGRGRPARTETQKARLATLLAGGQSKNEAKITLEGLKILGL
jgi:hypothetical protein